MKIRIYKEILSIRGKVRKTTILLKRWRPLLKVSNPSNQRKNKTKLHKNVSSRDVVFTSKTRMVNQSVYDPERQDASGGFQSRE